MKLKICQIGYLKFGIGHYLAHLAPYLTPEFDITYPTFTHGSSGDPLIMDDSIVTSNIKNYLQIINPHGLMESLNSIEALFELFNKSSFDILNLQISSYTRKSAHIFIPVIEHFKGKGVKIVYTIHDALPNPEGRDISDYLTYYYSLTDMAICGNEQEKNELIDTFTFRKPVSIATHGIYNLFNSKTYSMNQAREKLGIDLGKNILLFFGILRSNKGLDDLIQSMKFLDESYHLIIAVSDRLGVSMEQFIEQISSLGLQERITLFVKNEASHDEIEQYFSAADVVILPYTSTSQSGILNLAFAFEKPAIITNVFAESTELDERMGFVVPPKAPDELANKIEKFFSGKSLYLPLFQRNIQAYNKEHSFQHTSEIYKQIFHDVMKI